MLFRIVYYSEWPKLRPAHLFFLGSAYEQLSHASTCSPRSAHSSTLPCFFNSDFGLFLARTLRTTFPNLGLYRAPSNFSLSDYSVTYRNGHSYR